jgi:DNA-binding transcriptional ArsR family regulator
VILLLSSYIIKDPEVAKLLADETRRGILHMLRHNEFSATDLAKSLKKSHSSIVHHLNLLLAAGLIEQTRTEKVRNMVQPFYRSVSRRFHVSYTLSETLSNDPDFSAWQDNYYQRLLEGLNAYNIDLKPEKVDEVKEVLKVCYMRQKKAWEDNANQRKFHLTHMKHADRSLAHIITNMHLLMDEEYLEALHRLSEIIKSLKGGN